ncbi:MAG: hypothetical protein A2Z42_01730 [Candidatus Woykebacteria bacterium RBG_19FT_COMBO_43_10]|uniref:SH3b domain-containing protein n=1 Tax=Candidatus Woykebacteria bacterium RBG_19FT_COMBO_43_10 TaxID=1802598 RepID=A0A1G1WH99_9BACT|nr:MAG: hypothetical protein A2Z42_01730 [Candidatus Woykebacteria bacterium RBG_19FT_COMBO_43_10]
MRYLKILLVLLLVIAAVFLIWKFVLPIFKSSNSFLKVTTPDIKSQVLLDDRPLGKTPYLGEMLTVGDYDLLLKANLGAPFNKAVQFSTPITLTSQALTAVNYDFGPNEMFSSGDIRTFRSGEGLSIITRPRGADIWLDGEEIGKSPKSLNPSPGVHKLKITAGGFITRELEINIEGNYRLVVEVFLAQYPFDEIKELEEGRLALYDLSLADESLLSAPSFWAEGVFFFEKNEDLDFDALIDAVGKTYFKDKATWDKKGNGKKALVVGYLGDKQDKGLTEAAKDALNDLKIEVGVSKEKPTTNQVQILSTPTGILNVRSGPGLNNSVIAKINPGEKYQLLNEKPEWYKIKLSSGETGWISSQYAKKL